MPKVSVIVPIYNVEKYIERCARSLFEQTLDDIEYIFIDDCTPDNSIEILKKTLQNFPAKAESVRIVKMASNSGVAAVRSHGIQLATGDYIIHCDSDDWVDIDLYEKMYDEAIRTNADVVVCPIRDEYVQYGINRTLPVLPKSCKEAIMNINETMLSMYTWNKLVRRRVYVDNNILPFEGINMWEDNGLMFRIFYHSNLLSYIGDSVYHYNRSNNNAMTTGYGKNAIDQMIQCASLLGAFFESKQDGFLFYRTVNILKFLAKINLVTDRYDWLKIYNNTFPEANDVVRYLNPAAFSKKGRVRFIFVKLHLEWLFVTAFKLKKIFI